MASHMRIALLSWLLVIAGMLAVVAPTVAQGSVTPSFGSGTLVLVGEGYRAGERVELAIRIAGATHHLTATADARGHFRLDTGLAIPPLSALQIEARDEQGQTQATITSGGGGNLPPGGQSVAPVDSGGPPDFQDDAGPDTTDCAP